MAPNQCLVHVYYAPLNFRDIMLATGKLAAEVIIRDRLMQVGVSITIQTSLSLSMIILVAC